MRISTRQWRLRNDEAVRELFPEIDVKALWRGSYHEIISEIDRSEAL
jgi:hypothetical protein